MSASAQKPEDPFPVMENMTVRMVREYLERKRSVILPIGVIEQHGYHLPLRTDALIATGLGRRIGRRTGILVAPTMHQSFSGGQLPGTINISPAVMSLVVSETLLALAGQGFRNFYLLVCHGGSENTRAIDNALKMLLRTNPAFADAMIALLPSWKFARAVKRRARAGNADWHAGVVETSLVMALAPRLVRMDEMRQDEPALLELQLAHPDNYQRAEKIVDDDCVVPRLTQRPDIKVGVMGYPQKASPQLGREIIDTFVKEASEKILELESKADGVYREVALNPEPLVMD